MPRTHDSILQSTALDCDDDDMPEDLDAFRLALAQRLNRYMSDADGLWRVCPQRVCGRARACRTTQIECPMLPPLDVSPEEGDRLIVEFSLALKAYLREKGRDGPDGFDQQS